MDSTWIVLYVIGVALSWLRFQQIDQIAPLTGARYLWYPAMTLCWPVTAIVSLILRGRR